MGSEYDDFERALLRAGKRAAAPAGLRRRATAAAVAAGSAAALAGSEAAGAAARHSSGSVLGKAVAASTPLAPLKWIALASVVTAAVGIYAAAETRRPDPAHTAQPQSAVTMPATSPMTTAGSVASAPPTIPEPPPPPRSAHAPADTNPAPPTTTTTTTTQAPRASASVAPPAASERGASLAEELRLIDAARQALADGETTRSLRLIAQHRSRHPTGSFAAERDALHVDALLAAGATSEAIARAQLFVEDHPKAAQADRMRRVAERAPKP